jgi:branched-chain amino acid transport system permease protein
VSVTVRRALGSGYPVILGVAAAAAVVPLFVENPWLIRIVTLGSIFAMFAVSWDLLGGYAGQINLGHALFFGASGYASGLLNLSYGVPIPLGIAAGTVIAVVSAFVLGVPCLRVRGPYLGIVTLVVPLVVVNVVFAFPAELGGDSGIGGFAVLANGSILGQFYLCLAAATATAVIMLRLARGNIGLILKAIRDSEPGAESAGVDTTKYKLVAFALSAMFAGIAGGLYVHVMGSLGPVILGTQVGFLPIIMTYVGGAGTIVGAFVGGFLITILDEYMLVFPYLRILIWAGAIIVVLRFLPGGILGLRRT